MVKYVRKSQRRHLLKNGGSTIFLMFAHQEFTFQYNARIFKDSHF
jgi:hypothetical protein